MIEFFTIISFIIALLSIANNWELRKKKTVFWMFIILLILADGLRWEMGADWTNYYTNFIHADRIDRGGFELGFTYYTYFVHSITDNYSVYLLITSAAIYIGIFYTVFKITEYSFISVFYLTGCITWYSGSMRQIIAAIFFTIALQYVYKRKLRKYLFTMTTGVMFHSSILIFLPMYWIFGLSFFVFFVILILLFLFATLISNNFKEIDLFFQLVNPDKSYSTKFGGSLKDSNPLLGFLRKILTTIIYFYFWFRCKSFPNLDKDEKDKIRFLLFMTSLSILFYFIGTYYISTVSSRLDIYTGIICAAVLIGLFEKLFISTKDKLILLAVVAFLVVVFYMRLEFFDLFHPYSSIFYNYDYHRALY